MLHRAPLTSSTTFSEQSLQEFSQALTLLLSDVFALYLKTKNFHWHMSGSHFRDYHLILDDQGEQIFAMTDAIAERARKLGGATFDQLGRSRALSASRTNDAEYVRPLEMLAERRDAIPVQNMREIHSLATRQGT